MSASQDQAESFCCIRLRAADAAQAEWALAEAFAAGASGVEERLEDGCITFDVYAPTRAVNPVRDALAATGARVLSVSPVLAQDWSEAWKRDLVPIVVSPRLALRPSFATYAPAPGQRVLVLDPGQAFGTGAHESTRLALEGIDAWAASLAATHALLDVGTGSGVLALAALSLGCGRAVGVDLDPLAGQAARENALHNALAGRFDVLVGGIEALAPSARFAWLAANLLASELRPLLPELAERLLPGGRAVLSGLLEAQAPEVLTRAAALGLEPLATLCRADASGARWVALILRRAAAR